MRPVDLASNSSAEPVERVYTLVLVCALFSIVTYYGIEHLQSVRQKAIDNAHNISVRIEAMAAMRERHYARMEKQIQEERTAVGPAGKQLHASTGRPTF